MTLPTGNPVVANTDITTAWANPTMADLAAEVEDSLSRSGKGGMLVPFQNLDGTTSAPGITFTNQTGTGFSRSVSGLALSIAGAIKALFSATLARFYTAVQMDDDLTVAGDVTITGTVTGLVPSSLPNYTKLSTLTSGSFGTSSLTEVDVTGCTVSAVTSSFGTSGRYTKVELAPEVHTSRIAYVSVLDLGATDPIGWICLYRAAAGSGVWVKVGTLALEVESTGGTSAILKVPPGSVSFLDTFDGVTGTSWDYKLTAYVAAATNVALVVNSRLLAYEL
jgi:hypothetical protein